MSAGAPRYRVRPATPADAGVLIGLFNRAFRKAKDERTARWKYFESPHGTSTTRIAVGLPEQRDGGAYSYVYRSATASGRPFVLAQASDAMVDEEFRKRGIFTGLDDACAEEAARAGVPIAFATAGRQSLHGFLKNGWREIGTWSNHAAVFDGAGLLRACFPALPALLARIAGALVGLALRIAGRRPRTRVDPPFRARRAERFDDRATALFEQVAPALPIAGRRDRAWLDWRYVDTPTRKHRIWLVERGADLAGYAVVEDGGGLGFVVDLLGADEAAEDAALAAGLADLAARGVAVAEIGSPPCPRLLRLFRRNGLIRHPRPRPFRHATPFIVRVLLSDTYPEPGILQDPAQWYALDGDRDVEHMTSE